MPPPITRFVPVMHLRIGAPNTLTWQIPVDDAIVIVQYLVEHYGTGE